jgi:hypothetical protein
MASWTRFFLAVILSFIASIAFGWIFFVFAQSYSNPSIPPVMVATLMILLFFALFIALSVLTFIYES